ncbi:MAG TPA: DUF4209 domain-containing protein [Ktedonobacteraceae bacterium]|nr:DUF4209 domain-containing protein [Ktedonobacteraceae bacterium]
MNESVYPLIGQDFNDCDWQSVVDASPNKLCLAYSPRFLDKAAEAKAAGDLKAYTIYTLFANITYPILRLHRKVSPFEPSNIFTTISDGYLTALAELAPDVSDPELRARIADVLWIIKHQYPMVRLAIDAYLEVAHAIEDPEHWVEWVQRIERAFRLAASIDQKKTGPFVTMIAHVEELIECYHSTDTGFLTAELMALLQEHKLGDAKKYAAYAQEAATRAETEHRWHWAQEYWKVQAKWYALEHDTEGEREAMLAHAEAYVKEAEDACAGSHPSYMAASEHLESAIHHLRMMKGTQQRVEQLHRLLLEYEKKSLAEYKPIMLPLDTAYVEMLNLQAGRQVKGKSLSVALFELAFILPSPSVEDLKRTVQEMAAATPLSHLFGSKLVNMAGKTTARSVPLLTGEKNGSEEAFRERLFTYARTLQSGHARLVIEPARKQLYEEHHITAQDMLPFVTNNPFVPSEREEIYARALAAGFDGDFLVATHLLIPQVENSLRSLPSQQGHLVSTLTSPQGIQDERSLNIILQEQPLRAETVALIGEDTTFDLEGLLVERLGSNLRNEVAHGLLDADRFGPGLASYFWWLVLKLCIYHWFIADLNEHENQLKEPLDRAIQ